MGDGIWHFCDGAGDTETSNAEVFGDLAEQTRLADKLGYASAWFAVIINCGD